MSSRRSATTLLRFAPLRGAGPGFTLLEMVVVITIIAIIAASLVGVVTSPSLTGKRLETVNEMQQIERAIMGRPEYGDYGFLGTMGRLPQPNGTDGFAMELLVQGSMPAATATPANPPGVPQGIPVGWNGPYLKSEYQDPTRDGWAMPYTLQVDASGFNWRIVSSGPDRQAQITTANPNNSGVPCDDIVFPSQQQNNITTGLWFKSRGDIIVDIWGDEGPWAEPLYHSTGDILSVSVWYPDGTGAMISSACDAIVDTFGQETNTFRCNDSANGGNGIPFGLHAVTVALKNDDLFGRYSTTNYTFSQNVSHVQGITYAKLTIAETPTTIPSFNPFDSNATGTSGTTPIFISGKTGENGFNGLAQLPSTARTVVGDVRTWGEVTISDTTTTCRVHLKWWTSPDNGTSWDANGEMAVQYAGPSAAATAGVPFSISGSVASVPNKLTAFQAYVDVAGGSGTCTVTSGRAQMFIKQQLLTAKQ